MEMGRRQAVRQRVLVPLLRRFESFRPRYFSFFETKEKIWITFFHIKKHLEKQNSN